MIVVLAYIYLTHLSRIYRYECIVIVSFTKLSLLVILSVQYLLHRRETAVLNIRLKYIQISKEFRAIKKSALFQTIVLFKINFY